MLCFEIYQVTNSTMYQVSYDNRSYEHNLSNCV